MNLVYEFDFCKSRANQTAIVAVKKMVITTAQLGK
jgi:hypothetical protein